MYLYCIFDMVRCANTYYCVTTVKIPCYNLMGSLLHALSITDGNISTWHMIVFKMLALWSLDSSCGSSWQTVSVTQSLHDFVKYIIHLYFIKILNQISLLKLQLLNGVVWSSMKLTHESCWFAWQKIIINKNKTNETQ